MIKAEDAFFVLCNGTLHSIHSDKQSADDTSYSLAVQYKLQQELGSDARPPRLAIVTFPTLEKMIASVPF
jgi:hypothetical protein